MVRSNILATVFALIASISAARCAPPIAQTTNGTYQGAHLSSWNQDAFLGIPYAQPPTGQQRFRWPRPLNSSFDGVRNATTYGFSCRQYGHDDYKPGQSEDCLSINVVRPSGKHSEPLPVLVWIYGGGFTWGSSADPQYNLSGIVKVSQEMRRPMLAVSFNYRVGIYGFLQSSQLLAEGSSNAGFADMRLALRWIQENIGAFGGDPKRVTVWGESAGAQAIGYHLFAYDGRDDGLFQGAIMESGGPRGTQVETLTWYSGHFDILAGQAGCAAASNKIQCLRDVDEMTLWNTNPNQIWNPLLDGDMLTGYPFSQLAPQGKFNPNVALLIGTNTDEGFGTGSPNTDEQLLQQALTWRRYSLTPPTIRRIMELYPDDPCYAPPYHITDCRRQEGKAVQARRANAIGNDFVMQSGRRQMAELYTQAGKAPVYSYRFDQRPWNAKEWDGVAHFVNVAFSFQNISGAIGPSPTADQSLVLARKIGRAYVNFVHDLNPNGKAGSQGNGTVPALPEWPAYTMDKPTNMVMNNTKCEVESDTYRKEGMAYMMTPEVAKELLS